VREQCSLVPHGDRDGPSVGSALLVLRGKEVSDESDISRVLDIKLAGVAVLELRMVDALLGNDLTAHQQNTGDFEIGLFLEHAHLAEGVLSEAIKSLHETFKQVQELILNLTFLAELLVVQEPEGVSLVVNISHHLGVTFTHLVGHIDEVGLKGEQVEGAGGQGIKWVDFLLGGILRLGLGSTTSGGGLSLLRLLLGLEDGLERLFGHLDLSEASDEFGEGGNARKPGASLGGSLGEALVKDDLEGHGEGTGDK